MLVASDVSAVTLAQRQSAAAYVADLNPQCTAIQPFYWEIGDGSHINPLEAGTVPPESAGEIYQAKQVNIASATKWIYAAYIAEKLADYYAYYGYQTRAPGTAEPVPLTDVRFLTMTSGYHSLNNATCQQQPSQTVGECLAAANGEGGFNDDFTSGDFGNFWYDG